MSGFNRLGLMHSTEAVGTNYLLKIGQNDTSVQFTRLYQTRGYQICLISLVILSGSLLSICVWSGDAGIGRGIIAFEAVVALLVILDLIVLLCAQGCNCFFTKVANYLDLWVLLVCLFALTVGFIDQDLEQMLNVGGLALVLCRNAMRLVEQILVLRDLRDVELSVIDLSDMGADQNEESVVYEDIVKRVSTKDNEEADVSQIE